MRDKRAQQRAILTRGRFDFEHAFVTHLYASAHIVFTRAVGRQVTCKCCRHEPRAPVDAEERREIIEYLKSELAD